MQSYFESKNETSLKNVALSRVLKAPTYSEMMEVVAEVMPSKDAPAVNSPQSLKVVARLIWDKFLRNSDLQLDLAQTKN